MELSEVQSLGEKIKNNISKVIIGKEYIAELLITSMVAGGHVLLEDVPGTGKTLMAKSMAKSIGIGFKRVQFTPDLLPSDLTGINYYNQKLGEFTFRKGPVFTNILLADEINRATPRTQSSLLECMEEHQITVDGATYILEDPYFVIATENPVETHGTFPLPEAQLDRFLMKVKVGYPSKEEGKSILSRFAADNPLNELTAVCSLDEITAAMECCRKVYVSEDIQDYIIGIVDKTREHEGVILGVSPRGSLALMKACQVYSALKGSAFVYPEVVKELAPHVLSHRVILKDTLRMKGVRAVEIINDILKEQFVPTEKWSKVNRG